MQKITETHTRLSKDNQIAIEGTKIHLLSQLQGLSFCLQQEPNACDGFSFDEGEHCNKNVQLNLNLETMDTLTKSISFFKDLVNIQRVLKQMLE